MTRTCRFGTSRLLDRANGWQSRPRVRQLDRIQRCFGEKCGKSSSRRRSDLRSGCIRRLSGLITQDPFAARQHSAGKSRCSSPRYYGHALASLREPIVEDHRRGQNELLVLASIDLPCRTLLHRELVVAPVKLGCASVLTGPRTYSFTTSFLAFHRNTNGLRSLKTTPESCGFRWSHTW